MNLNDVLRVSLRRSERWHVDGIEDWSPLEWAGAMAGEAGEACNAAKKLKRMELGMATKNEPGRHFDDVLAARAAVAREVADTILYAVLLAARVGVIDIEAVLASVFNRKSEEYGFPERLSATPESLPLFPAFLCRVCGWPLAAGVVHGCTADSCSMRPAPSRRADEGYAPEVQS